MKDKVSIIVPVYNAEQKLSQCMDSILGQSYKNIEVILVDDGSKDNSLALCKEYESKDKRVQVVHTENQGAGPARNEGIERASGTFAYFPDADDILDKNAIERILSYIPNNQPDLVVFGYEVKSEKGKLLRVKEYDYTILDGDSIRQAYEKYYDMNEALSIQGAPWNKFFSMKVIKDNNVRYPALKRHQDEAFISRYMSYATKVCFIPEKLYTYFTNEGSTVRRKYPVYYVDCVRGLYEVRRDTILSWNRENKAIKQIISDEYLCNTLWSFELSFDEKYGFDRNRRIEWIKEKFSYIDFDELDLTLFNRRKYESHVCTCLRSDPSTAYKWLHLKAFARKVLNK